MTSLAEFVEQLPPDIQKEIKDFCRVFAREEGKKRREVPTFDWEGALKDLGEQCTSVELQHKILEMRGD